MSVVLHVLSRSDPDECCITCIVQDVILMSVVLHVLSRT